MATNVSAADVAMAKALGITVENLLKARNQVKEEKAAQAEVAKEEAAKREKVVRKLAEVLFEAIEGLEDEERALLPEFKKGDRLKMTASFEDDGKAALSIWDIAAYEASKAAKK